MDRRRFLQYFSLFGLGSFLGTRLFATDGPAPEPYGVPITTPTKVIQPDSYPPTRSKGFTILQAQRSSTHFGLPTFSKKFRTQVWGFNGLVPGQPFRMKPKDSISLSLDNQLDEPVFMDFSALHGTLSAIMSSSSIPVVAAKKRESMVMATPIIGTYIYRSGFNILEQSARGLSGVVVVDDPHFISDADYTLTYQDWSLDDRNQLAPAMFHGGSYVDQGFVGQFMTVNGRLSNTFTFRKNERIRLRLVNLCLSTTITLIFTNMYGYLVALDSCPLPVPVILDKTLALAPGQRVDLLMDMYFYTAGHIFVDGFSSFGMSVFNYVREKKRDDLLDIQENPITPRQYPVLDTKAPIIPLRIDVLSAVRKNLVADLSRFLKHVDSLDLEEEAENPSPYGTKARANGLNSGIPAYFTINDAVASLGKPLFTWKKNTTILLHIQNTTGSIMVIGIERHISQLLAQNDVAPTLSYWRDVHYITPNGSVIIGFKPEHTGTFLIRSSNIGHYALGLFCTFVVV